VAHVHQRGGKRRPRGREQVAAAVDDLAARRGERDQADAVAAGQRFEVPAANDLQVADAAEQQQQRQANCRQVEVQPPFESFAVGARQGLPGRGRDQLASASFRQQLLGALEHS
jgi:hypothetical protein